MKCDSIAREPWMSGGGRSSIAATIASIRPAGRFIYFLVMATPGALKIEILWADARRVTGQNGDASRQFESRLAGISRIKIQNVSDGSAEAAVRMTEDYCVRFFENDPAS